jgi:hypothetical protein
LDVSVYWSVTDPPKTTPAGLSAYEHGSHPAKEAGPFWASIVITFPVTRNRVMSNAVRTLYFGSGVSTLPSVPTSAPLTRTAA